ncbi:MAG TPA: hypothetical protein VLB27_00475, partial [candidate division Zixibacteria bacterium]|nr:hypothetical protein [candidate division Zixibacteria bacterium]
TRQDGFQHFFEESAPAEETEIPRGELEDEEFNSLERLTDFFGGFRADEVMQFPDTRIAEFINLLDRAIRLLEDARHFDPVGNLAKYKFTDKANFIQAADEIYEDIPQELFELKREIEESRLEGQF